MRKIADTNILLRYMTRDDESLAKEADNIILQGVEVARESIPELIYVLTSPKLYALPRNIVAKSIAVLLDDVTVEDDCIVRHALEIYAETKLDFVDCLLVAKAKNDRMQLFSFDQKLLKEFNRRCRN